VRFFTQMYWLESGNDLSKLFRIPQFRPAQLTITIRYSDWWFWEDHAPLAMEEGWLRSFKGNPGLRKLVVEYETVTWKKPEMMSIIERNKKWKLPIKREGDDSAGYEGYLSAESTELSEWKWNGASKLDGVTWSHHFTPGDTVEVVVTDTWTFVKGEMN
jgi:hypothetical protein